MSRIEQAAMNTVFGFMVLLCHGVVGTCIMAVTMFDLVTGSNQLTKLRKHDG